MLNLKKDESEKRRKIEQLRTRDKIKKLLENTEKREGMNMKGKRLIN